jgi:hypothetical protein
MCVAHCDPKALGHPAWNAGRRLVQKATKTVRAFDLAIDSKLRGCDLMKTKIGRLVTGVSLHQRRN